MAQRINGTELPLPDGGNRHQTDRRIPAHRAAGAVGGDQQVTPARYGMRRPLLKAAANAVGSAALAFAFAAGAEAQTTIRVPLNYPTIQAAIDAAANGDTVLVAPGTYVENIDFSGKAITVASDGGPEVTLIDGSQADSVVKFISGEERSSVLSGFTVLNGRSGFDTQGYGDGGGIWMLNSSPTIVGNIIANNRGCQGSGISITIGSPLIQRNTIINNRQLGCSGGHGAGIALIDYFPRKPQTDRKST